jgi:YggT family protein
VNIAKIVLTYALELYLLILIVRMVISWIQAYSRDWTPHGFVLVVAEGVYTATDPPLKVLRRYIPSPRLGRVAFDLSFMVLFLLVLVLLTVVGQL